MKRSLLLVSLLAAACSTHVPENEFHIEGHVAGLRDSVAINIVRLDGSTGSRLATDTLIDGKFSFFLPMTENIRLSIMPLGDEFTTMIRHIWAVPGEKITITGKGPLFVTWNIKSRVPEQHEADRYIFQSKDEYIRRQLLSTEDNRARKITDPALRKAVRDSLSAVEDKIDFAIFRNDIALMEQTPFSDIWLEKLGMLAMMIGAYDNYAEAFRDDALRLYEKLSPEQKELPMAQTLKFDLFRPEVVGVGDAMADAELKAFDGTTHRLSEYLGKFIILDFWGSGCGPCVLSMPELKRLAEKYPDALNVVGINIDTSEKGWRIGTEMFNPSEPNLNAPPSSDIDERYGVSGIPHFVIISPEGTVLESWVGYGEGLIESKLTPHIEKTK